jgi:hypothetical protein
MAGLDACLWCGCRSLLTLVGPALSLVP